MRKFFAVILVCGAWMALPSCYTTPSPGVVKVIVLDQNDFRVPGATLVFYQDAPSEILYNGITDANGEFTQAHTDEATGQALEVWLKVQATLGSQTGMANAHFLPGHTMVTEIHL